MSDATGSAAAPALREAPQHLAVADQVAVSLLWFALFANWLTVVPVIVPDQIAAILGPDAAAKEGIAGSIQAMGAFIALVVAPLAGALSDRTAHAKGRRRPFLVAGMIGSSVGMALLVPFGPGANILLYALAILNLQFWWNVACGPYAGLIPDVVPAGDQARASAWMNIMSILGTFLGNFIAVALYVHGRPGRRSRVLSSSTSSVSPGPCGGSRSGPPAPPVIRSDGRRFCARSGSAPPTTAISIGCSGPGFLPISGSGRC